MKTLVYYCKFRGKFSGKAKGKTYFPLLFMHAYINLNYEMFLLHHFVRTQQKVYVIYFEFTRKIYVLSLPPNPYKNSMYIICTFRCYVIFCYYVTLYQNTLVCQKIYVYRTRHLYLFESNVFSPSHIQ